MRVLVAVASKYGSTREIAEAVASVLGERELDVDVFSLNGGERVDVDGYDAVVLGSAVYMGNWMSAAKEFAETHQPALHGRPVWLFSSGPVGDPPLPDADPSDVPEVIRASGARDHRVFAGKLDKARLTVPHRAIAWALRAPEGDFRDWARIRGWAEAIADALRDVPRR